MKTRARVEQLLPFFDTIDTSKPVRRSRKLAPRKPRTCDVPCLSCGEKHPESLYAQLCCLLDPRDAGFKERGGKPRRHPGNWCLECGVDVPEGRSFCKKSCSCDYEAAHRLVFRGKPKEVGEILR